MRFGRTQSTAPARAASIKDEVPSRHDDGDLVEPVLDALTAILQLYARHSLATENRTPEEARDVFGQWSRHVSLGRPAPGQGENVPSMPIRQRQWRALITAFGDQRRGEVHHVDSTVGGLRDTVWAFLDAIHGMVHDDSDADRETTQQLERVRVAAAEGSADVLRQEALATVQLVDAVSRRRRLRQQERFAALAQRLDRLDEELEVARRESATDPLTGLANRRAFDDVVARIVTMYALSAKSSCLLMIDLDHFKNVNDAHGHQAGDEQLQMMAGVLSRVFMRRCDFVARYGGDEFAVILHDTRASDATVMAERLIASLDAIPRKSIEPGVGISVGIAEIEFEDTPATWVERADRSLYAAKVAGRGRVGM